MMIQLPEKVGKIIHMLEEAGFEAYAVGGCVRDAILGREPSDWDITTDATPMQIKRVFKHTVDTGIEHGTVTVLMGKGAYEVTTYRIDGKYSDGRHPDNVEFTPNLEEDLKRRDFTINAMAYNEKAGLVDMFHGRKDLENRIIRAVGNAPDRLNEDALRILRAVRFAAQIDFDIDDELEEAIRALKSRLKLISAERIQTELYKLLTSPHPERIITLYELGVTGVILPEFDAMMATGQNNPHHCYTVGEHTVHALKNIRNDRVLRLTMLFHDMGKPSVKTTDDAGIDHFHGHSEVSADMARTILRRLKSDNETVNRVCHLVKYHDLRFPAERKSVRRAMSKVGGEEFPFLLEVMKADVLAQSDYLRKEKLENLVKIKEISDEIYSENEALAIKDLAVDGSVLIKWGVHPGPEMGSILKEMLEYVLEDPARNNEAELKKFFDERR